ncbi:MAG: hypothetical protein NC206_04040 [Bacteroides sp.]|nr:hypothetical protein [Roseburia sp.]MCM1346238.1 hypothetical protein [Bacteroides sp.]MCM1421108.1 hypothetical protein [Bacteroides sp.]
MAYAYSDNPLGPFVYGGTIIDARGRDTDADGKPIVTAVPFGNTHGSIAEINGQWWVFYHRQNGTDEFSRQAMVAPIDVKVEHGRGGKVLISEAEYTSEGFETGGLDPLKKYPAAIASHITSPKPAKQSYPNLTYFGSYFKAIHQENHTMENPYGEVNMCPVVNNTSGSTVGYKYFNFDKLNGKNNIRLALDIIPEGSEGTITVYTSAPWKGCPTPVGMFQVSSAMPAIKTRIYADLPSVNLLKGKKPLYLVFNSPTENKSICELISLQFEAE